MDFRRAAPPFRCTRCLCLLLVLALVLHFPTTVHAATATPTSPPTSNVNVWAHQGADIMNDGQAALGLQLGISVNSSYWTFYADTGIFTYVGHTPYPLSDPEPSYPSTTFLSPLNYVPHTIHRYPYHPSRPSPATIAPATLNINTPY
jgi:hypothetical protein